MSLKFPENLVIMAAFVGALVVTGCGGDPAIGQNGDGITPEQLTGTWKLSKINNGDNRIVTASRETFDAVLVVAATGSFTMTEWRDDICHDSDGRYVVNQGNLFLIYTDDLAQQANRVDEAIARVQAGTLTLAVAGEDHYRVLVFERQ